MNRQEESLVLIADDDQLLCTAVSKYLSKLGIKTVLAYDGAQALEMFHQLNPQVIVADLRMPIMDGLRFLAEARKKSANTPVIITTGYPDVETAVKALQIGAYDYLVKPFQLEMLHQKIQQALKSTTLARENLVLSELVSLHDITNHLTSTHNLDELLDVIFRYCMEFSGADSGCLQLYDSEKQELVLTRSKGFGGEALRSPVSDTREWPVTKWVLEHKTSLIVQDNITVQESGLDLSSENIHSAIAVALKVMHKVIGVVYLNRSSRKQPYTPMDIGIIEVLAAQAGIAISNANLYASINQKLDDLSLISTYSEQLMGLVDKYDVIRCLFETIIKYFPIDFIAFLVVQKRNHEFLYWAKGAFPDTETRALCKLVIESYNTSAGTNIVERRVAIRPLNLSQSSAAPSGEINVPLGFRHVIPVCWEDFNFGAVLLGATREPPNMPEKLTLLASLVSQTRIALTNSKLYNDMKENYIRTIKALAIAVDAKDTYTHGHSENVMNIAEELAREMSIDEKMVGIVRDAGLLHDIGKIGIPGYILNKPGPLTYEEFNGIMKTHSTLGANIVKDVPFLQDLYGLILYHHEHYDGGGYPEGLRENQIPVGARILHVSDAFEAMTSNRPYRNSLGKREAIKRLVDGSGKQFDPEVVDAFLRIARRKGWLEEEKVPS